MQPGLGIEIVAFNYDQETLKVSNAGKLIISKWLPKNRGRLSGNFEVVNFNGKSKIVAIEGDEFKVYSIDKSPTEI